VHVGVDQVQRVQVGDGPGQNVVAGFALQLVAVAQSERRQEVSRIGWCERLGDTAVRNIQHGHGFAADLAVLVLQVGLLRTYRADDLGRLTFWPAQNLCYPLQLGLPVPRLAGVGWFGDRRGDSLQPLIRGVIDLAAPMEFLEDFALRLVQGVLGLTQS
jgi:hypothetical protein